MNNLLSNAAKFTHTGEVVVTVTRMAARDPRLWIRFSVRDTGIGIPRDKQALVFSAFEQEDNSITRRFGGTGSGSDHHTQPVRLDGRHRDTVQ